MARATDPYYDPQGCLVTPSLPPVPATPSTVLEQAVTGWNAGANSIATQSGDLHTVFSMPTTDAGAVLGLRSDRLRNTTYQLIEHGLYFQATAGHGFAQVMERGAPKTSPTQYSASDTFEIRRVGPIVTYLKNGATFYVSHTPSFGTKLVNGCLYLSGDSI